MKMYSYAPGNQFPLTVTDNFDFNAGAATQRKSDHKAYAFSDDVTIVKGPHQFGFGANVRHWDFNTLSTSRTGGSWTVDGQFTGHALADLLLGRVARLEIGGPNVLDISNWYFGTYAQDAWRLSEVVTVNVGLRWEPYFGQQVNNNAIVNFNKANFDRSVRSTVFVNAPPGLIYPGDAGFPEGKTGLNTQWGNFAPRAGVAWDVRGDGRVAIRSSYSMGYDFMAAEFHNINAGAPPFGNRSIIVDPPGRMDDPWGHLGGDPHPIVTDRNVAYIPFGAFGTMSPDINSPRVQQWNATLEQQVGAEWGISASYLGSYADRLWAQSALNPGVFLGLGPCSINNVSYTVCSTNANLNQRRRLFLENPRNAAGLGALDLNSDVGWQKYSGLRLSARRRSANGVSLNATYTLSKCTGTATTNDFNQTSAGYTDPSNPNLDAGYCDQDRRHLGTLNIGYETPEVGSGFVRAIASNWRLAGILNARSGSRLNIVSGRDNALTGIAAQRPNVASGVDIYGPGKNASDLKPGQQIENYFNRDAFSQPAAGSNGNAKRNLAVGPSFRQVDLAISKLVPMGAQQRLELRVETFNLFNTFNWGNPVTNLNAGTFGRITTQIGDPRIVQFGIKYDF